MKRPNPFTLALGVAMLLAPVALPAADTDKPKALQQCEKVTGSVIRPRKKDACKSTPTSPLRTFTKEDIQRTGEMDLAEALRKLDPSFR